jgi:hypothetical protein
MTPAMQKRTNMQDEKYPVLKPTPASKVLYSNYMVNKSQVKTVKGVEASKSPLRSRSHQTGLAARVLPTKSHPPRASLC